MSLLREAVADALRAGEDLSEALLRLPGPLSHEVNTLLHRWEQARSRLQRMSHHSPPDENPTEILDLEEDRRWIP